MQVLSGVEEVDWKGVGRLGLRPRSGSSWDDWLQRCEDLGWLRREGWLANGVRVAVPACSESGCNALLGFVGGLRVPVALWLVLSC